DGPIVPLIAETGGINAMIVDATALPEQVADDVVTSAFRSAGQRCSALRLLFLQDDVADRMIEMIAGAARQLRLGDPADPATHIDDTIEDVVDRLTVGNIYVNRNMIGAVVGVQPFGGFGLSGTGPKAGGPHYLARFATEQTVTVNTAAAGGNAALLAGGE